MWCLPFSARFMFSNTVEKKAAVAPTPLMARVAPTPLMTRAVPNMPPRLEAKKQKALDKQTKERKGMPFGYDYLKRHNVKAEQLARANIGLADLRRVAGMAEWSELASLQFGVDVLFARSDLYPVRNMVQDFHATWEGLHYDMGMQLEHLLKVEGLTPRDLQAMRFRASHLQGDRKMFELLTEHANITPLEWKEKLGLTWEMVKRMDMQHNAHLRKAFRK